MLDIKPFDVVVAPFPFSDMMIMKRRPAIVISSPKFSTASNHYVLAMITSARHSSFALDTPIKNIKNAMLPGKCIIRMKLFTADHTMIVKKLGSLSATDKKALQKNLQQLFDSVI